jgi:hypothetical protein
MDTPPPKSKTKTVEVKIAVPTFTGLLAFASAKKRLSQVPRKVLIVTGALGVIAIIWLVGRQTIINSPPANSVPDTSKAGSLQRGTPDYPTILPANKTIEQLGGWTRVSPPDRNPVFAYVDKIGNIQINVSQQPLPAGFEVESDGQIEQLAAGYKANEKITVGTTSVHIGTSVKGPQSVIFSKDKLLVLIKSSAKVSNNDWAGYVNSLQ